MSADVDHAKAQRVELILQQVDALPTLSPVAMRLLRLSSSEDADIREIVSLVEADVTLSGRLLSLCRRVDRGLGDSITTVERAVVMLGFDVVRSTLLSVHLFELLSPQADATLDPPSIEGGEDESGAVDRKGMWRYAVAVASAAELLAQTQRDRLEGVRSDEAYLCGLMHDLGKYALDLILPRSFARVAALARRRQSNIAEIERSVIGVDHHVTGKRLAEHWGLPLPLQDVIWLNNQPYESLPDLPHKPLIGLTTVAAALTRRLHIGWSGDYSIPDVPALALGCGLDPDRTLELETRLHERVAKRIADLGLEEETDLELSLRSVMSANAQLGSMNRALLERRRESDQHERVLGAIAAFHRSGSPARSLLAACGEVVRSATELLGEGFFAVIFQTRGGAPWQVVQCDSAGRVQRSQQVAPPAGSPSLSELADTSQLSAASIGVLPWIQDYLLDAEDLRRVRLLPLSCAGGGGGMLLHDRDIDPALLRSQALPALTATWWSALQAAANHEGARRLGEQLAEANRTITETQSTLTAAMSLARLGEMAAGIAHEMNNPLTIISGRSQMLMHAAHLSDLITALHFFADPPRPTPRPTDLTDLLALVVRDLGLEREQTEIGPEPVRLRVRGPLPPAHVDPEHVSMAVKELLRNAIEARPAGISDLRVYVESPDDRLVIEVTDDGCGMSRHALQHAFDPFFSEKPAGRQGGLGLARASRLVEQLGGWIALESEPGKGTTARIILENWRPEGAAEQPTQAA